METSPRAAARLRPYVIASCAMSLDGRIDNADGPRLILSGPADLDRVDEVRASCDAILVGAGTVRRDDPRLAVRDAGRRAARVAVGLPPSPIRVVLSASGRLAPTARVFAGPGEVVVYRVTPDGGPDLDLAEVLADLADRGVRRLLVEGGTAVHTAFLTAGLVDELHLVVAPFFVGDPAAPAFVGPGHFPHGAGAPLHLAEVRQLDDVVLLRYLAAPSR
nr:dihydrofolate reductase family protein [Frankia sp. AgKG'84/4]